MTSLTADSRQTAPRWERRETLIRWPQPQLRKRTERITGKRGAFLAVQKLVTSLNAVLCFFSFSWALSVRTELLCTKGAAVDSMHLGICPAVQHGIWIPERLLILRNTPNILAFVAFNSQEKTATKPCYLSFQSLLGDLSHCQQNFPHCMASRMHAPFGVSKAFTHRTGSHSPNCLYPSNQGSSLHPPDSKPPSLLSQPWGCLPANPLRTQTVLQLKTWNMKLSTHMYFLLCSKNLQKNLPYLLLPSALAHFLCTEQSPQHCRHPCSPAFRGITESFSFSTWQLPCFSPALKWNLCFKSTSPSCSFELQFSLWILQAHQVSVFQTLILWLLTFFRDFLLSKPYLL